MPIFSRIFREKPAAGRGKMGILPKSGFLLKRRPVVFSREGPHYRVFKIKPQFRLPPLRFFGILSQKKRPALPLPRRKTGLVRRRKIPLPLRAALPGGSSPLLHQIAGAGEARCRPSGVLGNLSATAPSFPGRNPAGKASGNAAPFPSWPVAGAPPRCAFRLRAPENSVRSGKRLLEKLHKKTDRFLEPPPATFALLFRLVPENALTPVEKFAILTVRYLNTVLKRQTAAAYRVI